MTAFRLLVLLLWAHSLGAATLTGLRWFDNEAYVRVVFDVSTKVSFRTSDRPENGYVDLILEGELAQGMRPRIEIGSGPVEYAEQKMKTSTSLTWRIHTGETGGIRSFGLGEKPYKIVIDVYKKGHAPAKANDPTLDDLAHAPAGQPDAHAPAKTRTATARKDSAASAEPAGHGTVTRPADDGHGGAADPAKAPAAHTKTAGKTPKPAHGESAGKTPKPAHDEAAGHDRVQVKATPVKGKAPAADPHGKAPASHAQPADTHGKTPAEIEHEKARAEAEHAEPSPARDGLAPWEDLEGRARTHAEVGSLLLDLGLAPEALEHLEAADSLHARHPGISLLLGSAWFRLGDEYRSRKNLETAVTDERFRARAEELLGRLQAPDAHGLVPGGEIETEDLEYFLSVLRRGSRLDYKDLTAPVVVKETTSTGFGMGMTVGLALAGVAGLVGYVIQKRGAEEKRRKQILSASQRTPPSKPKPLAETMGLHDEAPMGMPSPPRRAEPAAAAETPPAPRRVAIADAEDNAVYQQVQAELERHLEQAAAAPLTPESLSGFDEPVPAREAFVPTTTPAPAPAQAAPAAETELLDEPDLNEQVYTMADANRPIVEIAETLELGEDEVKLILDLRPQLPDR